MNTEITEYAKASGWIYYDADCRFCTAMARRFRPLLAGRRLELLPLQTAGLAERLHLPNSQLLEEMRVLRPDGQCFGGADALLEVARDFWWAWPVRLLGRIGPVRWIFRIGYRWVARRRSCAAGGCEIKSQEAKDRLLNFPDTLKGGHRTRQSRIVDFAPLAVLPLAVLLIRAHVASWVFMWAMAFAVYWGCKWLTYRGAIRRGLRPGAARVVAYLLAWPGMDAADFLDARKVPAKPQTPEWLFATAKMGAGIILLWVMARLFLPRYPLLAGWTGMIGVVFILHFGLFHLLSLFWRRAGIVATPVMQNPILACSLSEFWGRRWNTAFNELAFRFTYRPFRRLATPMTATVIVFGLSGLIHDLLISLPAGAGYGLPTLYFLLQGFGIVIERSRFGRLIGLGRGKQGWLFTLFITVTPAFWLFHPPFITNVILPMLNAIGAT